MLLEIIEEFPIGHPTHGNPPFGEAAPVAPRRTLYPSSASGGSAL